MEDNTNQVVDPFTSLPMERGEKPIDPFTGKPMTSIKPRSTVVSSAYDIPTYGKNDYRDYNVNLRPGVDVNEQRAQNQSRAEQWRRGLTKLGTTALSVAVEGPVGLANGVGEALYHQDIDRLWNNTTGKYVDEFNEWMNTTMPIYKTKAEQEAIGLESLGNATFWAQDFTNGVGYAVGALAGGGAALKGLKLGTKALRYGAKGLFGADKMSDVHNVMKAVQRGEDVGTTVTNIARKNYVQNAAERLAVGASMTHAESSVEAREMFKSAEQNALQTMANEKGVSIPDLSRADRREAKEIASKVSNMGYLFNTALVGWGNWAQFGKAFFPSFRQMRPMIKGITKAGGEYAEQSLARRVAGNIARRPLKNFFTEAGEEGGQFLVAQAADDLAAAKSSMGPTSGPQDWAEALGGAWSDLDTKEGLDSLMLGALVGAFTGGGHNVLNRISGAEAKESGRRKLAIQALNSPQIYNLGERAKAVAENDLYINLMNKALEEGDHKGYRDAIFNLLAGEVIMHDNLGTIKYYRNQIEDAGNMSKEEFAKAFGIREGVDFNPKEIINGINDKIDEFLDIKERIDIAVPGRPNNRTIGDWIKGANTEEEKKQREDEEVYRNMLYQYTWKEKDVGKRMQSLVDELNAATRGEAVTEEVLEAPLTTQELQEEGKPITESAELLGKKPYVSMSDEAQKRLQDAVDRIQDPLLRAEMQMKKDDLVRLSNDRARAVFALEELMASPDQRVAAVERRRATEKAAGEEQIRAKAEDVINSTVTAAQLEAFVKTSEFTDLPLETQARVRAEQTNRHNQEIALKKQHADQPLKEMQNRVEFLNNLETKTPAQELEALILQQSIDGRREDPTKEPAPEKPKKKGDKEPEGKPDTSSNNTSPKAQKSRADKHTKNFRDATDPVEKLTAAYGLLTHFNRSQERGIDSMLDPDVLLEVNDTVEELKKEGYEIIDHRGQKYDDGLLLEADFIPDETLKEGERIIDFVYEPEIRKDGKLIKAAKVRVRQGVSKVAKGDGSTKTPTPAEEGKPATVKLMGGEFENDNGRIVLDDTGNPVPGLDATKPFEIDRNFVKTPEGIKTLQEKGVEFKMSPVYDFTYPDGKKTGKKGRAILVFVPGTNTIIGILPGPKKDKTSATIAKLLETQDSVPGKVENFMFGGRGNFIQGAELVPAADVIDLKTDAVAAIGIVKESNVIFGQTIEGREFGDLQTRRLGSNGEIGQRFNDGQVVMAIQYPNGQFASIPFSTLEVGQEGVDYLKEQLNKGIDGYTVENIRIKMGIARELKPNGKMVIFESQDNGVLFRFMLGTHVIQMTAENVRKMMNIGQFEWTTGKLVENTGDDGRTNYKFETNDSITREEQIEIQKQLVGGGAFSDIVRSSKRQVDEDLLAINPKGFVGLNGVTHPDYYTYLMKDILRTDTRFVNGLPVFDVGIEMSIDAQVTAEQAVEQTELKKQSGPKRTTAPTGGAGSLKPKKGKRKRRGAASKAAPTTEPKAPESNQTEITYKNNVYVVTFEGLGGKNTIVNKKSGREILTTSSVGKNVMDLWEVEEGKKERGAEVNKEQLLARAAEVESRIKVLQAIISEGEELTPEQNEEYSELESELYHIMKDVEPPYEEDNVPFRLEEDRLAQDVLLDLLEKYGFEINEADNLLINLAAKKIELNTMDNSQVAEALATPLSRMIMESGDSDQLRKAIRNSIKFPLRADKARREVQAERDKIKKDKIANGVRFREELFDRQTKEQQAKAEERVVDSILVDLLKEGFDKKLAAETGIDRSLYKKIKAFIDEIIDYLRGALSPSVKADLELINDKVQLIVENSFMPGEFIKLKKKPGHKRVDFQEAFNGDRAAHLIQTELSKNPNFILTGSIAFSAQGSTWRSGDNIVHDLDYVVLGGKEEGIEYLEKKFPAAEKVYDFNPGGAEITTFIVPPGMYKIDNIQRMRDYPADDVPYDKRWTRKRQGRGSGKVVYYELKDIETDEVVGTFYLDVEFDADGNIVTEVEIKEGITGMFIDLFSNSTHGLDYVEEPFKGTDGVTRDVKLSRFDIPFGAKLLMGRNKDIWDYNRFIPKERVGVRRPRRTIDPTKAKSWVEQRFGEGSAVVFDTVQKVDNAVVHGYMENAAVHLWSNAELGTEYHEGFHLFFRTMLSDKQRQQLYDEMLKKYGEPSVKAIAKARRGKPNLSDAEARFLALEEKMAEDFRLAQINREVPSTIGGKIAKFFRDLMYYIKALVTDRIGVQQAFHMLGENRIPNRFSRTAERFSPGRAFMMRNYALDPDTHKELVDTATYLIREAISNNQFDVEAALGTKQTTDVIGGDSAIRDWFLRNSYHVADDSGLGIGRPLTNQEFKRLKEAYESENEEDLDALEEELNLNAWAPTTDVNGNPTPLGMQGFDTTTLDEQDSLDSFMSDEVISRAEDNAEQFRMVYDYWHDEFNELGGRAVTGFRSDIVDALKASGITIRDEELVEEDDEGADKIYTKSNFEVDPASKLGKDFKILLSSIPIENPEQSRFGFRRYMFWKDIYNEMAGTVANANNFVEMVEMLGKRGNDVSTMKHVADWVANLPANQQALLYAMLSQSMTEHRLIMIEPVVAEGAVDATALVKIINSSVSSNQRYFRELWKDKSTSIDGVYTVNVSTDGTETVLDTQMDQDVANRLQGYLKEYDTPGTTLMRKQELVATMMMDMGLTIAPSLKEAVVRFNDYLSSNGIPVDEFLSNQTQHTNLRQIISTQMAPGKDNYSNVFITEGRTMDYIAREIMGRYEAPKLSSFYNAFGELRYPLNLTTDFHLTTRAIKSGEYAELMTDAAGHHSGDKGTLAYLLASNEQFQEAFDIVDIESIRYSFRGEDQIKEYQDMSYLEALAIDLAMFNREMDTRMISVDTQADRPKLSYTTIPNIRSAKARQIFGITEFGDNPVGSIARRTYLMDLHRMFASFGSGSIDNPIMRYHEGGKTSLGEIEVDGKTEEQFAPSPGALQFQLGGQLEPDTIFTSNYDLMRDAYDAVEHGMEESKLLREFLDKEVQGFTARVEGYTQDIVDKVGGEENLATFIKAYVQPKNGYTVGQEMAFLRDFTGMSVIGRLVSREFLRGGINYTKDGAAYVKRSGHSSTPGYLLAMRGTLSDPEFGMPPTFNEITVRDLITSISPTEFETLRNAFIKQLAPSDAAFGDGNTYETLSDENRAIIDRLLAPYGKNNGTDAQAFITMDMYRFIQQGLGVWDNFEERAYQQYISAPKGQRVWTGKPIKAMKPSYDLRNVVMINGKKHLVPIVHKNSYVVLTDQLVEGIPNMMNLLNYMETNDVQVANTDSAKKLGSFMPVDITDLSNAKIQTLDSKGLKFPQILPRKKKQEITFGRQPRKNMVANIKADETYVVAGVKMTGRQMLDLYFKAVTGRLQQGHNTVMSRLGLDAVQAATNPAAKKQAIADAMVNIREVVAELGIEKTFTQNFLDSLEVVADADGTVTSALPFSFPTLGPKLENVIMSMFRNEAYLMKLPGQEMVQFAEFGAHERDGSLKFYEVDGDRVTGAQVDIGYDVLKRMGIDPDAPIELIQEGLDELLGYRIPQQSKASMYVLKIRNVIKGEHSGIIRVPPATTTLMGSDFDVDKLFVIFPELEVIRNEEGEAVRVQKVKPDYEDLLTNINDIDFTQLDPKILNNIVFDTFYAVGSDVKHLTETTAVMDLDPSVDPIIQAMELMGRPTTVKIDINSPHDRLLSGESNMLSMRLRGIYANAVAGRNVLETLVNVYGLNPTEKSIVFESDMVSSPGEEITVSEITIDGFTYQSDQILSMYLSRAVDSVNDPIQSIINDNATTAPLTVFMLSAGFTPQQSILFLNVPIVKAITDAARAEGMTVKNYMREMYGDMSQPPESTLIEIGGEIKGEDTPTVILFPELGDMAAVIQASDRGEKLPDNYDEDYYLFALQQMAGKASRLQNYHSLLSPDNIDQKGTIPLHQEMMDKSMNLRDDLFGGMAAAKELITKVLEPDAEGNRSYDLIGGFYDAGKITLDMMGQLGFVANQPGVEMFKSWVKSASNKKYLNEMQHRDINRMITHHIYTMPGSPIFESGVLDYDFVESTFFDGGLQNIILGMRNAVGAGENIVLNTLLPTTEVINEKEFTYLKFNIAALDDIGKNQFSMLLDEMITNPSLYGEEYTPIVQMFTRAVISNSVITSGFTAGPTSYFNLIPQSYWNSLTNSSGEDFRTHANRAMREMGSTTALLSQFKEAFLMNYATHNIGRSVLFSNASAFGVGSLNDKQTISLRNKSEFVVVTDTETGHKYLFQRFSDDGAYKKVRTKGKQYRLNETYLRGSNGLPTQVSLLTGVSGTKTILPPAQSRRLDLDMPKETESGYRAKVSRLRSSFAKAGIDVTVQEGTLPKGIKAEVEGNVVTVDTSQITEDTTYHEFGHILLDMLPEDELDRYIADIKRLRPDLAEAVTNAYPDLQGRALGKEILTTAIGIEGARIERKNPSKLRMLINRIMRAIGRVFGVRPDPAVVLAEEMFGKQIRKEGLSGVFSDAIRRSIELQGRIQKVYTQVNSSLKRQKAKLQGRKDTETQKQKLKEVQAQLNSLEAIKNKALVNQEQIDDFFNFQQFVLNKAESIENTLNDLLETEHKALTRSEIYNRLKIIDSLREDIDSLFSGTTENSAIFQMSQLIQNLNFEETDSEEVREVLKDLDSAARRLADSREVYLDAIIPMMSKLLLSYADPMLAAKIQKLKDHVIETKDISGYRLTSTTNSPDLKKLKAEYRQSLKTTEPMTMDEYKAKALEIKLRDLDKKIPGKEQLDAELRTAHVQKSGYAAMIDPIVYSSEMNVQLLGNALRAELQEADNSTVDYVYDLEKVYEPFKELMGGDVSPSKLNKKLITTKRIPLRDDKGDINSYMEVLALEEPFNTREWYTKRAAALKEIAEKTNRPKRGAEKWQWVNWNRSFEATTYDSLYRQWYENNSQPVPNADKIWEGWNTDLQNKKGELNQLEAESNPETRDRQSILEVEIQALERRIRNSRKETRLGVTYLNELAMPSDGTNGTTDYSNPAYAEIMETPELKNYYEFLKDRYFAAQKRVGKSDLFVNAWDDYSYVLPSVRKNTVEDVRRKDFRKWDSWKKLGKEMFINPFVRLDTDTEYGVMTDVDGDRIRHLPRYFTNLVPATEVTTDLAQSMTMFEHMSHQYEAKSKMTGLVNGMLAAHEAKGAMATVGGLGLIDRFKTNRFAKVMSKDKVNKELEHLRSWVDTVFYGELKESALVGNVDFNKVSSGMQRATAANSLMLNTMQIFNQAVLDNFNILTESVAGEFWSMKDAGWAIMKYSTEGAALGDTAIASDKFAPKTKLGKVMQTVDAMVDIEDQLRNIKGNKARKIFNVNTGYAPQRGVEHQTSALRMLALMKATVPLDKDGNKIEIDGKVVDNLYDAFIENEQGRAVLDPRVANVTVPEITGKLRGISKRTNQVKGTFDRSMADRHWFFSMLMLFRNYIPGNIRRTFGHPEGYHVDHELGQVTRGALPSVASAIRNVAEGALGDDSSMADGWAATDEVDRANLKRVAVHMLGYLAAGMLFASLEDDDDEYASVFTAYQARRLQTEITGFLNPFDFFRMVQRPLATSNTVLNWLDLVMMLGMTGTYAVTGGFEDKVLYQRRQGKYSKGDLKLYNKFNKVLPTLNGWQTAFWTEGSTKNVAQKIKWFNL